MAQSFGVAGGYSASRLNRCSYCIWNDDTVAGSAARQGTMDLPLVRMEHGWTECDASKFVKMHDSNPNISNTS
jgi:hypothetical protein